MRLLRHGIIAVAPLAAPSLARSYEKPYDPYPWCAVYASGSKFGGTNGGFPTLEQCRATVSGIGGNCEPNQFYNPHRTAAVFLLVASAGVCSLMHSIMF